jgi:pyrroloquinoline quinone biosynthesis protein B
VLGAAAGGGFPQWNSAGPGCQRARANDLEARPSSQCSLAVSGDDQRWVLLDASPDLRMQINATPQLWPSTPPRSSPICSVVLTSADVDRIAGLLTLRERHSFVLWATPRVHGVLNSNSIFNVLAKDVVRRCEAPLDQFFPLRTAAGEELGISCRMFAVPGKVPLFLEHSEAATGRENTQEDDVIGLEIATAATRFFYIPGCASIPPELACRLQDAPLVFFDGTLWTDDEMIVSRAGSKTGQRMGHISVSGSEGTMAQLANAGIGRKIFVHVNNTNPLLLGDSKERAIAAAQGWEVGYDGMEIRL